MMEIKAKKFKLFTSIILCFVLLVQSTVVFATDKSNFSKDEEKPVGEYVEGEAVVLLNDKAGHKFLSKSQASKAYGKGKVLKSTNSLTKKNGKSINFATIKAKGETTEQLLSELKENSAVKYAVPNYIKHKSSITNDSYSDFQWAIENKGQNGGTSGCDIKPDALWSKAKNASEDAIVAVMDTGIDYNHEDLKDSLWVNPYGSKLKGIYGYDFTGDNADRSPLDDEGHGTHVSGIIAAQADNAKGISGLNKTNVKIMSLKILDEEGSCTFGDELNAFNYIEDAIELGANIKAVNMSYGGIGDITEKMIYDEVFDVFGSYGIVSCIAAGNENINIDNIRTKGTDDFIETDAYYLPAESESDYAVTVGASNEDDDMVDFSNKGKCVDIAAPGTNILSTVSDFCFNPSLYTSDEINQNCKYYQNFESGYPTGFGKPNTYNAHPCTTQSNVQSGKNSFASDGAMVFSAASSGSGVKEVVFSFPYTISNTYEDYQISFMLRTSGTGQFYFDDRAGSFDTKNNYEEIPDYCWEWELDGSNDWNHICITNESDWLDSTSRQLVFYVVTDGTVAIDDFAISYQNPDKTKFGKYDFYSGTSMACPYVAGAVALISNARADLNAYNIVSAIKETGRYSSALSKVTETGKTLSVEKIMDYVPPKTGKTGDCRWLFDEDTGVMKISGRGNMGDYNYSFNSSSGASALSTPWSDIAGAIKRVEIADSVTSIGDGCFAGCTNLTEISIPSTVTSIGNYAFFDTALSSIKLPNNIKTIGKYALGYIIDYVALSGTYAEAKNSDFKIYAYTGSKTAATLKSNRYQYKSLGGLTLKKYSATIYVKGTVSIKPKLKNVSGKVTYKSSNKKIAKVSSSGKITAVKKGTAKITVKRGDLTQTFKVTVKNPKLNATKKTIKKGKTFKLKITGKVGKATFKTSNKKIATVSSAGKIKAKKKGKATITVKTNGMTLKCKVTVK